MDVPDRSTRVDVLSIAAIPAAPEKPAPASSNGNTPSFADALQRGPADTPPANSKPGSESAPPSNAGSPQTPKPAPATATPTVAATGGKAAETNLTPAYESVDPAAEVDPLLSGLIAGLVAAAAAPMPNPPPAQTVPNAVMPPPAALVQALQAPKESVTEPKLAVAASEVFPAIPIPAGLQVGLCEMKTQATLPTNLQETSASTVAPTSNEAAAIATEIINSQVTAQVSAALVTDSASSNTPDIRAATTSASTSAATAASPAQVDSAEEDHLDPQVNTDLASAAKPAEAAQQVAPAGDKSTVPAPHAKAARVDAAAAHSDSLSFSSEKSADAFDSQSSVGRRNSSFPTHDPADTAASIAGPADSSAWLRGAAPVDTGLVTAPPDAGTRFPPIVAQLQPALHQAVTQDRQLTITLRPPELGPVQIDVLHLDGRTSARLQTETASAHQLLTEHLPQLREVLTQMGVAADQVQVVRSETPLTDTTGESRTEGRTDAQTTGQQQESRQQPPAEPLLADDTEREETHSPNIRTRTSLNLRI